MRWLGSTGARDGGEAVLERAVAAWRSGETRGQALTPEARGRILDAVHEARREEAEPASLFLPTRRLAFAAAAPLALTALVMVVVSNGSPVPPESLRITAAKEDGRVVFTVADGSRTHYVSKSAHPGSFETTRPMRVDDGTFTDPMDHGPSVVYYRID